MNCKAYSVSDCFIMLRLIAVNSLYLCQHLGRFNIFLMVKNIDIGVHFVDQNVFVVSLVIIKGMLQPPHKWRLRSAKFRVDLTSSPDTVELSR